MPRHFALEAVLFVALDAFKPIAKFVLSIVKEEVTFWIGAFYDASHLEFDRVGHETDESLIFICLKDKFQIGVSNGLISLVVNAFDREFILVNHLETVLSKARSMENVIAV